MRLTFFALFVSLVSLLSAPSVAHADDDWSLTAEHKYSQSASIRVVEPEGYQVTVGDQTDTVPAVFKLRNEDAYHVVRFTSPDGKSWERKVEVRANNQTVVRVRHVAAAPERPAESKPTVTTHIGKITNSTHACSEAQRSKHRFDFRAGGKAVASYEIESGTFVNAELAAGTYEIRRFVVQAGKWVFQETDKLAVGKDGWEYNYGCGS